MDKIIVRGGKKLTGTIFSSGSKNAGLPIMAASILAEGKYILRNVPDITDIQTMIKLLRIIGAEVVFNKNELTIINKGFSRYEAPYDLVKTMRASIYVLGPLLARFGKAKVSFPGGCALGARPINLHLEGLQKLGTTIEIKHGYIYAYTDKLKGGKIFFEKKSVGATANILMASVLAQGITTIENASCEPEITSLAHFLNKMGAKIKGIGTEVLTIQGVKTLHSIDTTLISDRIETATFLLSAAITNGNITIKNCSPVHLGFVLDKIKEIGFSLQISKDTISITDKGEKKPVEISTNPYPGFPTDLQPPFAALLSTIKGKSIIYENIFSDRVMYISELQRLGADIKLNGNQIIIKGGNKLTGAPLIASDIRAAAALIIAALASNGKTEISRVYHLDRGYERLEEKLAKLGADIERVKD
ncbi:MAG: UDP-N-acetylglucosamine 1-carboxyvinyltransferase [Candidatus Cloacimonetes bacterium]|nr:UDP-N-acetylglucosamine 1-carboxyvinyltransferase [Candidatus Cloacimonadota bacterium]MBL7086166.1 UDP-N-acetylglucosamine 1-carboxyvinyltransferase [Candidatus Cloacimonadota bacterium]